MNLCSKFEDKWNKAIIFTYDKQKHKFDYSYPRNSIKTEVSKMVVGICLILEI